MFLSALLLILAACGGIASTTHTSSGAHPVASSQVLVFPNVGTQDIGVLDPAQGPDANSGIAVGMIYSGLVKFDQNLEVVPDQASSWTISPDNKTYTFKLNPGIMFSDGTPVTAQTYVYTLTRQILPQVQGGFAQGFFGIIDGANDVINGKTTVLRGVRALDDSTLQITLTQPAAYFLDLFPPSFSSPLNNKSIPRHTPHNS